MAASIGPIEGPTTMMHKRLCSGASLLAAALTGTVAPARAADKGPNMGNIALALAGEIAMDTAGVEGFRG